MNPKMKNIVLKCIYVILIIAMLVAFVYLSEKYKDNSKVESVTINDYYPDIDSNNKFEVINGTKLINIIRNGKNVVFIGSKSSSWSSYYLKRINDIINDTTVDKVYYYDINNDKSLLNSNYYEILDLLEGYLLSTDDSSNNLFAPSLYIIENGRVLYYNVDTAVMKNSLNPSDYWTDEVTEDFVEEIENALNKYYLNN